MSILDWFRRWNEGTWRRHPCDGTIFHEKRPPNTHPEPDYPRPPAPGHVPPRPPPDNMAVVSRVPIPPPPPKKPPVDRDAKGYILYPKSINTNHELYSHTREPVWAPKSTHVATIIHGKHYPIAKTYVYIGPVRDRNEAGKVIVGIYLQERDRDGFLKVRVHGLYENLQFMQTTVKDMEEGPEFMALLVRLATYR